MTTFETELTTRFAALADRADDASWAEVVARARASKRHRRRVPIAIAAALASAVVIVSPATGVGGKVVRLFDHSKAAPQRVVKSFAGWNAPDLRAGAQPERAIKVLEERVTPDRTAILWVAPSRAGFCTILEIEGPAGDSGCEEVGYDRLSVWVSLQGGVAPDGEILGGPVLLYGSTGLERADALVLRFQDGDTKSIPLVWVTAPIDTGFFVYGLPERHWQAGHLPTTLTLFDAEGHELDRRPVNGITTKGSLTPR